MAEHNIIMATQKRGKYCVGELCNHKNLQLCKSHKCSGYNGIVHLVFAAEDATTDKQWFLKYASKPAAKHSPSKQTNKQTRRHVTPVTEQIAKENLFTCASIILKKEHHHQYLSQVIKEKSVKKKKVMVKK
eukprot:15341719-Ditylum_brightwellii.AAC.1